MVSPQCRQMLRVAEDDLGDPDARGLPYRLAQK